MKEIEQGHGDATSAEAVNGSSTNGPGPRMKCSYCGKVFYKQNSNVVPFCSLRCQQVDLGLWLNESYGLPVEGAESEFDQGADEEPFDF